MRSALWLLVLAALGGPSISTAQELPVYHVSLHGTLDARSAALVARALTAAAVNGSALVLEIASPGTDLDAARAVATLLDHTAVPVFAFVQGEVLNSALLIPLAADSAFLAPGGRLGWDRAARGPPGERGEYLRRLLSDAMEQRGVDPFLAAQLLAGTASVPGIVVDPDRVLITDTAALLLGLARQSPSVDSLVKQVGLAGADIVSVDRAWLGVTIRVENRNWRDVRVYLVQATQRVRVGTVTSMNELSMDLSEVELAIGRRMQLVAEVIGSPERLATPWIQTRRGLVIEWRLENVLSQSSYFHWVR